MKFHVTTCEVCGKVDGSIHIIESYNCERDLKYWRDEGRKISQVELKEGEKHDWCDGHEEGEV